MKSLLEKELIVFDLDGTLTPSKANMDAEMRRLLAKLLAIKKVAVIGGGSYQQFKEQFLGNFKVPSKLLSNLSLFPATSTLFYRYKNGWEKEYSKELPPREKQKIRRAFKEALQEIHYVPPPKTYGRVIEDRGAQMTFSALGQDVVKILGPKKGIALKKKWHKTSDIRPALIRALRKRLLEYEHEGGFTSVDVTKKGIDKAYGVREIKKALHVPIRDMVFVGDALFPGGNDYAAKKSGVDCIAVRNPEDTKKIIKKILKES